MGIRVRNLHNYIIVLKAAGALTAAADKDCAKVPFSGVISNVVGKIATPGTGATNTILDVNLNGTTIFGAATKVTFASTTGLASYSALTSNPTNVTFGSMLTLDADAVPTGGKNAVVEITITRTGEVTAGNLEDQDDVR
jgi:hypothetical protein